MHVLIADDDPGTRLALGAALEELGHRCTHAEDGDAAWRLYQAESPDVVITDWQMPGMDGTALVRAIRGEGDARYAYVMVLTGVADEQQARQAMEAGADEVLIKPLDPAELERKLIAAERVSRLHRHDSLTGLANRRHLAEDLDALCGRVARYGHSYCAALFAIDDFPSFDDAARRQAAQAVAETLQRALRSGDAVYRYGGAEFLVLLPEQSIEWATVAAERLRAAVEDGGVVTVSGAVVALDDPERMIELADQALALAKEGNRNRVGVYQAAGEHAEPPIRLLVAHDDATVRLTIAALVRREPGLELVGEAEDTESAVEMAARRRPVVVLLDVGMPGGGGARAAAKILEASPGVKIVALGADESAAAQYDMTRAGAVGYLVEGADDEDIVRVIRSSARW